MGFLMKTRLTFARFDAELNTDVCDAYNNAELTLTLRMGFRQVNPAGGAAEGSYHDYGDVTEPSRKIIKWTDASWAAWKTNFVQSAQNFWDGKFWLINDAGVFAYRAGSATYFPNVWCRFKLEGKDAGAAGIHHTIDVVRLHGSESWFGSHSTLYDSKDTDWSRKGKTSDGKKVMQRAHVHEVGHLLGLDHVDVGKPHCLPSGNTNASACYGVADEDKLAVMGGGMQLRAENAYPWREAIRYFGLAEMLSAVTNPLGYVLNRASLTMPIQTATAAWAAKMKRHYPRLLSELQAGTLITQRPVRPK